jgi:hypothetical protein
MSGALPQAASQLWPILEAYVKRKRPDFNVYLFDWPNDVEDYGAASYYHLLNHILRLQPDTWLEIENTLIVIDEAQRSYEFFNVWNRLIKPLASESFHGPLVILFSSCRET